MSALTPRAPLNVIDIVSLPRMNENGTGAASPTPRRRSVPSEETTITPFVELRSVIIHSSLTRSSRAWTLESVRVVS